MSIVRASIPGIKGEKRGKYRTSLACNRFELRLRERKEVGSKTRVVLGGVRRRWIVRRGSRQRGGGGGGRYPRI